MSVINSSYFDTIFANNVYNNNNSINILNNFNINTTNDIFYGYTINNLTNVNTSGNFTTFYHSYKNNLITNVNIGSLLSDVQNNIYCFNENYFFYLDKNINALFMKRLAFSNSDSYNLDTIVVNFNSSLLNVYYFPLPIPCNDATGIFSVVGSLYVGIFIPDVNTILLLNISEVIFNYIELPKTYSLINIVVDSNNKPAQLLASIDNITDIYNINLDYSLTFSSTTTYSTTIQKIIINVSGLITNILTLLVDGTLNIDNNYSIHNIMDIFIEFYFLQNNTINVIIPNTVDQINVSYYNILAVNNYLTISNNSDSVPTIALTFEV
jgi:hypothetical protein